MLKHDGVGKGGRMHGRCFLVIVVLMACDTKNEFLLLQSFHGWGSCTGAISHKVRVKAYGCGCWRLTVLYWLLELSSRVF